jgi:hypothetical protein
MNAAKALYILGLRLKQLSLSLPTFQGYDLRSAKRYCGLAIAAYEIAKPHLNSQLVARQGVDGLMGILQTLNFASNPNHDMQPDISATHSDILTVTDVCLSYLENKGPGFSTLEKWFRVGMQMATVEFEWNEEFEDDQGNGARNEEKYSNWKWENKSLLLEMLTDLGASLTRLFPVEKVEEHDDQRRRETASEFESPGGWIYLELGLESNWDPTPPSGKRRCYQRDHQFLQWFEAASGSANDRYKLIAKRWSAEHSDSPVNKGVVKAGIINARREREHQE